MKKNDPSHDWYHVERVYKNALYIAEQEKMNNKMEYDLEIVKLGALFHDLVDFKYDYDKTRSLEEICRERLGEFFKNFNYPDEKREKILHIILNVSWRKELEAIQKGISQDNISNELKIVRDADRLDSIGAIGIARCFAFSGHKLRELHIPDLKPNINITYEQYNNQSIKNEGAAINHFYEKLIHIKDRMQTDTGKRLAQQRHDYMVGYLKQFDNELI